MPYSDSAFDKVIAAFIKKHKAEHYLDIGAGCGKYAEIIRKQEFKATIIGIESEVEYIEQFELAKLRSRAHV